MIAKATAKEAGCTFINVEVSYVFLFCFIQHDDLKIDTRKVFADDAMTVRINSICF